jgi:hypothetical protein
MDKWQFDLYATGSCIYELDDRGEVSRVVAWAASSAVARAAFERLCAQYPDRSFCQRRRAWVEEERILTR